MDALGPAGQGSGSGYATYLGGGSWDIAYDVALDELGAVYVVGRTASPDFPTTTGAFDRTVGGTEAFVVKLAPGGERVEYATLIGGSGDEAAYGIAVEDGIAYVVGETWSPDFLGAGALTGESDTFVVALDETGGGVVYATLIGGLDREAGYGIAVEEGAAYVTGITWSPGFPALGYPRKGDAFAVKLDAEGELVYGALLGGSGLDAGFAIAVREGEAQVTGETESYDFPASGYAGGRDLFVARLDAQGAFLQGRMIGGSGDERGTDLVVDGAGNAIVAGWTTSADLPLNQGTYGGGTDLLAARVGADGAVAWTLTVGGMDLDEGLAIGLSSDGRAWLAGATGSPNLPTTADAERRGLTGARDALLIALDGTSGAAPSVAYASYLGGSGRDGAHGIAVGTSGTLYMVGQTDSPDLPAGEGAVGPVLNGQQDAYLQRWDLGAPTLATPTAPPNATPTPTAAPSGATPTPLPTPASGPTATTEPTQTVSQPTATVVQPTETPVGPTETPELSTPTALATEAQGPTPTEAQATPTAAGPTATQVAAADLTPTPSPAPSETVAAQAATPTGAARDTPAPLPAATATLSGAGAEGTPPVEGEERGGRPAWIATIATIAAIAVAAAGVAGWMTWRRKRG